MRTINIEVDPTLENSIRQLLLDIQKAAPGVSLRALRSALWRLGMLKSKAEILKACLAEGRNRGSVPLPSVPLTEVRKGRPPPSTLTAKGFLASLPGPMNSGQLDRYQELLKMEASGIDPANAEIKPKFNIYTVKGSHDSRAWDAAHGITKKKG